MGGWYETHKFDNLIERCKFDSGIDTKELVTLYSQSLSQVYNSRDAFMKSADSVVTSVNIQLTLLFGGLVALSSKNKEIVWSIFFPITIVFMMLYILFFYNCARCLYKNKLIAGYDLYFSAVIHAAVIYQKLCKKGGDTKLEEHTWLAALKPTTKKPEAHVESPHSWLNTVWRNDEYLKKLDNVQDIDKSVLVYIDSNDIEGNENGITKFKSLELSSFSSGACAVNHVGTQQVHLALSRSVKGNIFNYYLTLLDWFCIGLPFVFIIFSVVGFSLHSVDCNIWCIKQGTWFTSFALCLSTVCFTQVLLSRP